MQSINGMAERLRAALLQPGHIELPGCHDVLSAMLLERAGFSYVFLSGYGVAASFLGNPDIGLTTLTETSLLTKNVTNRVAVPVVVDADNGYGNEDNVVRTIYELEHAGAAAVIMEDQVFPKRCGHTDDKKIIPLPHYMKKLECALKGRQTPLCIFARTDAVQLDEAIMRAKTFHAAGADVTLIDGLRSLDDIKRVADEVPGRKQINIIYGGKSPLLPAQAYADLGFKVVLYSTPTLYIAAQAMSTWMQRLHQTHDLNSISEASMKFPEFQSLIEKAYTSKYGTSTITEPSK
jgi:2-methylisocitrate lyase-like PEP mutase family enzyme